MELSEFDIHFKIRAVIKGQALANFVAEFTDIPVMEETMEPAEPPHGTCLWTIWLEKQARVQA